MTDLAHLAATGVACPVPGCGAQPGQECKSRKAFHTARASRGLSKVMRDDAAQHERAWRAQQRVRQAVADRRRRPDTTDVTTALACACIDCRRDHEFGLLLYRAGLI